MWRPLNMSTKMHPDMYKSSTLTTKVLGLLLSHNLFSDLCLLSGAKQ